MARCAGFKPSGDPCERIVPASQNYCYSHDPDRADERQRNASRAGKSKPSRELTETKRDILDVIKGVREGSIERSVGAVIFQGYNTLLKALDV